MRHNTRQKVEDVLIAVKHEYLKTMPVTTSYRERRANFERLKIACEVVSNMHPVMFGK